MHQQKDYTLAETQRTLTIIAVITVLSIGVLNLKNVKQRELIARFDMSYTKLDNIVQMAMFSSQKFRNWKTDQFAMSNLSCQKTDGSEETNKSECLKQALMSVSNIPKDCQNPIEECVKDYPKLSNQLKEIFPSLKPEETTAFTMPGGVTVLNAYLDNSCQMDIPINKAKNGDIEYVRGCGFLVVDVNGDKKPNNLIISKKEVVDRFLIALTAKGVVKSNLLSELAGCPDGTRYDSATKTCEKQFACPINMDEIREIESKNSSDLLSARQYTHGNEHLDCYEVGCLYGTLDPITKECPRKPTPCANSNQVREGGLWVKEGGSLPNNQEKACCIKITDQAGLAAIYDKLKESYCLTSDVTIDKSGTNMYTGVNSGKGWRPIIRSGSFGGQLYGNGHVIKNLYINMQPLGYTSLFGDIGGNGVKIENLGFEGLDITHDSITSVLASRITGNTIIDRVYMDGNIKSVGSGKVCGLGTVYDKALVQISNVYNNAGMQNVGSGIACGKDGTITNAYNAANLDRVENGISNNSLQYVYNKGNLTSGATDWLGGLAGSTIASTNFYKNLYNIGNLTATDSIVSSLGGVVAERNYGNVSEVYNEGLIFLYSTYYYTSSRAGGIIGSNSIMAPTFNMYNAGNIVYNAGAVQPGYQSGLLGNVSSGTYPTSTYIVNAYNIGLGGGPLDYALSNYRQTTSNLFGLAGSASGKACNYPAKCQEKTEYDMKNLAETTFAGFDKAIWKVLDGFYPTFHALIMPPQPHRDCRNNANAHGGCFDVLNTQNAWDFNYVWAWKNPQKHDGKVEDPIFRWQCKRYKTDGFDCCRPSYANNEPKLEPCPALSGSYINRISY